MNNEVTSLLSNQLALLLPAILLGLRALHRALEESETKPTIPWWAFGLALASLSLGLSYANATFNTEAPKALVELWWVQGVLFFLALAIGDAFAGFVYGPRGKPTEVGSVGGGALGVFLFAFGVAVAAPASAADLWSGGLSAGPAVIQRDSGAQAAFVPQVWAGRSVSDLVTAAGTVDLEISGDRPVCLAALGGRINLERSAKFRLAAGIEATRAIGPGADELEHESSWRALFVGSYIAARSPDGRPAWSIDYRPTLDFNNGKATHRAAVKWHAF